MIHVTLYRKDDLIMAFELSGHAESGPYGYDLVCAGVSAVTFGAVNAILALSGLDLDIKQADEGGYLYVKFKDDFDEEAMDRAQLLLEGFVISLQTIEREYGQFISIKETQEVD